MTLSQFLGILVARWKIAVSILVVVVLLAGGVSLMLPKTYTATASVVIEVKQDPISQALASTSNGYITTQVEILQSDQVARRVVRNLRLDQNQQMRSAWETNSGGNGDFEGYIAGVLARGLDTKISLQSSVLNVSYKSQDPRFSAAVANAFVQAYVDTTVDLRVNPAKQYSTFFDARSKELRDQVEKAQNKLSEFQRSAGIVATDERLDVETSRLNELSAQIVSLQSISAESNGRSAAASGRNAESTQDVMNNPVIGGLKADLARQESKYQELTSKLGDNHPQVVEARNVLTEMRQRLASETRRVTSGVGITNTINRQREADIRAAFDAQRTKVIKTKEVHDEAVTLQRDVDNAQRAYDAVVTRLNQQSLESQTTQANVSILSQAHEPAAPTGPRVLFNLLLGVFGGTVLGVGVALGIELLNRKVRSLADITQSLGLPVIGIMPGPDRKRRLFGRAQPLMTQRVLGQIPFSSAK